MKRKAFTLIELLVVIAVMIIVMSVAVPAVKAMLRNNSQSQAVNLIRAQLSAARTIAISQHRQAGVVFFEETMDHIYTANTGQTAMQIMVESADQAGAGDGFTIFVAHSNDRQYLPSGMMVATLNDASAKQILTGNNTGGNSRVIMFDANGQMVTRTGIARPNLGSKPAPGADPYPYAYFDWNVTTKATAANDGVSSPGILVFSAKDYKDANLSTDAAKATWIQKNADVLIVNAYTGGIINNK